MADFSKNGTSDGVTQINPIEFAWNPRALVPIESWNYDGWKSRQFRYYHSELYYHNQAYSHLVNYVNSMIIDLKLYKHIRGIYNPVNRLVEMYVSKSYGGTLDWEHLTNGAIQIAGASPQMIDALRQLWVWSNWGVKKSVYSRQAAMNGDVALKVVDNIQSRKVRLEVLNANKIKSVVRDGSGNIKEIVIEYRVEAERPDEVDIFDETYTPQIYKYTEFIDKKWHATYKNEKEFAYNKDANGNPMSSWPNEYGFVPVSLVQHKDMDRNWGMNCIASFIPLINEINDQASLLSDQIRKHVNAIWAVSGQQGTDIDLNVDDKDQTPMIFLADGAHINPLVAPLDINGVLANIKEMQTELERNCPELQLYHIQQSGRLTAPGVEAAWSDATGRLIEANGNYNHALVIAQQMAVAIGGFRGYDGFEGFGLDSYDQGDLKHYIADRDIIEDKLSKKETIDYFMVLPMAPKDKVRAVLSRLPEVNNDEIEEWVANTAATAAPAQVMATAQAKSAADEAGMSADHLLTSPEPKTPEAPTAPVVKPPQVQTGTNAPKP